MRATPPWTDVYISEDCESGKIQQPSQVERLLEALVSRGNLLPKECYRIRASRALSPQLQRVVERAIEKGHVWAAIWVTDQEGKWTRSVA
jgi:hypothetical protein